ncbi:MAG: DUF1508 domain-containing protein [Planctomycetota bacterium]
MKYVMYKDSQYQWRWRYVASNGRIIGVSSEAYHNKSDCLHSINLMKASSNATVYES